MVRVMCVGVVLGALLSASMVGAQSDVQAQWAKDAFRLETALEEISSQVRDLQERARAAEREGAAMRLSCLNQHLRQLRDSVATARSMARSAALGEKNPAYLRRSLERMASLERFAAAELDAGQRCMSVKEVKNALDIKVHGMVTSDAPEDAVPWTPVRREQANIVGQPPFASPF